MYSFIEKRALSERLADISQIDNYRHLLKERKCTSAGRKMLDRQALAVSLVYDLLSYYTAEELDTKLNIPEKNLIKRELSIKKKVQNMRNTLISPGKTSTTLSSEQPTVSILTGLSIISALKNLKKVLTALTKPLYQFSLKLSKGLSEWNSAFWN